MSQKISLRRGRTSIIWDMVRNKWDMGCCQWDTGGAQTREDAYCSAPNRSLRASVIDGCV